MSPGGVATIEFRNANKLALAKIQLYGAVITRTAMFGPEIVLQVPDKASFCALIEQPGLTRIWPDPVVHVEPWHLSKPASR